MGCTLLVWTRSGINRSRDAPRNSICSALNVCLTERSQCYCHFLNVLVIHCLLGERNVSQWKILFYLTNLTSSPVSMKLSGVNPLWLQEIAFLLKTKWNILFASKQGHCLEHFPRITLDFSLLCSERFPADLPLKPGEVNSFRFGFGSKGQQSCYIYSISENWRWNVYFLLWTGIECPCLKGFCLPKTASCQK